jgi:hypothetical protein
LDIFESGPASVLELIQWLGLTDLPYGLIFRMRVKPSREKYTSSVFPNLVVLSRYPGSARGALRVVTNAGRDAMDALAQATSAADADGESVWSWPPDAEVKLREDVSRSDGGYQARHPGERAIGR